MPIPFSGTTEKCRVCDKTVHIAELISADGVPYHKTCFRCKQCNGRLEISRYASLNGNIYCKPHFEQLFKETGSYSSKKFQTPSSLKQTPPLNRNPSKISHLFSGTQDKCAFCKKTAYPLEKLTVEGESYHKSCFRCSHGGCFLTPSSYAALDGILYCKHHFAQLFKEKGSYNNILKCSSMKKAAIALEPEQQQQQQQQPEPSQQQETSS